MIFPHEERLRVSSALKHDWALQRRALSCWTLAVLQCFSRSDDWKHKIQWQWTVLDIDCIGIPRDLYCLVLLFRFLYLPSIHIISVPGRGNGLSKDDSFSIFSDGWSWTLWCFEHTICPELHDVRVCFYTLILLYDYHIVIIVVICHCHMYMICICIYLSMNTCMMALMPETTHARLSWLQLLRWKLKATHPNRCGTVGVEDHLCKKL